MKTIIAGSRNIQSYKIIESGMASLNLNISEVISGGASGPDSMGEIYAADHGIPVTKFLPDWKSHGKSAGILRNVKMGNYADCLVAFWDGQSAGTKHMISYAKSKGIKVYILNELGMLIYESTNSCA